VNVKVDEFLIAGRHVGKINLARSALQAGIIGFVHNLGWAVRFT